MLACALKTHCSVCHVQCVILNISYSVLLLCSFALHSNLPEGQVAYLLIRKKMSIPVYFLRSRDKRVGFCFKIGTHYSVYRYILSDVTEWSAVILKLDALDIAYWVESMEVLSTTSVQLSSYDAHITAWAAAVNYSLFEGLGRTEKNFVEETMTYFQRAGAKLLSLVPPRVMSRELTSRTSNLTSDQLDRAREWSFLIQQVGYSDSDLVEYILTSGSFYYKTRTGDHIRSFYADQLEVSYFDEPITLPSDDQPTGKILPAALITPTASTSCHTVRPPVTNYSVGAGGGSAYSSGELLVAIMLFTILIVLIVIAVVIFEQRSTEELIKVPTILPEASVVPI